MKNPASLLGLLAALALTAPLGAEVHLPSILADHSVLQRQTPIHIWGSSAPGEHVTASFHGQTRTADANEYGEWTLWLMPEQAGGPYQLTVKGSETASPVVLTDVLVGDVWFASGQSNMEMPLRGFPGSAVVKNADQEIAAATQPQIRLLRIDHQVADVPRDTVKGTWTLCTPQTAAEFSAVAYFFGRAIMKEEHVPIGLIDSTWGGTPIESWISLDALGSDASLAPAFATWGRFAAQQSRTPQIEAAEKRADEAAVQAHQPKPQHPWHPFPASWSPAGLYNGMIAPLTPYTIRGFLWYQGETNSAPERAPLYVRLFPALIADWRAQWHQGDLPFLYVQISSFHSPGETWGLIRDAQRRTLSVANTAMAVSIDVGQADNVHPPDKQTVAARLALAAHGLVYRDGKAYTGPVFRQATFEPGALRVWFDHASGRLQGDLSAFEIAGADRKYVPAHAVIEGESVLVSSPSVTQPQYVRYAWDGESKGGLHDEAGLPSSTFTSDH